MSASRSAFLVLITVIGLSSCAPEDHLEVYEYPVTSMFLILTPDSGERVILSFIDNDGFGGIPALTSNGTLQSHTSYEAILHIGTPNTAVARLTHVIDSTSVGSLPELHQVFYAAGMLDMKVAYNDQDNDGNPIGFTTRLTTGDVSEGDLSVTILHNPNKFGENVPNGDPTQAGGTMDAKAVFALRIE